MPSWPDTAQSGWHLCHCYRNKWSRLQKTEMVPSLARGLIEILRRFYWHLLEHNRSCHTKPSPRYRKQKLRLPLSIQINNWCLSFFGMCTSSCCQSCLRFVITQSKWEKSPCGKPVFLLFFKAKSYCQTEQYANHNTNIIRPRFLKRILPVTTTLILFSYRPAEGWKYFHG